MELFYCKSKNLAKYLIKHGSKFIKVEKDNYIFEKDESIEQNLAIYEKDMKKCMF